MVVKAGLRNTVQYSHLWKMSTHASAINNDYYCHHRMSCSIWLWLYPMRRPSYVVNEKRSPTKGEDVDRWGSKGRQKEDHTLNLTDWRMMMMCGIKSARPAIYEYLIVLLTETHQSRQQIELAMYRRVRYGAENMVEYSSTVGLSQSRKKPKASGNSSLPGTLLPTSVLLQTAVATYSSLTRGMQYKLHKCWILL